MVFTRAQKLFVLLLATVVTLFISTQLMLANSTMTKIRTYFDAYNDFIPWQGYVERGRQEIYKVEQEIKMLRERYFNKRVVTSDVANLAGEAKHHDVALSSKLLRTQQINDKKNIIYESTEDKKNKMQVNQKQSVTVNENTNDELALKSEKKISKAKFTNMVIQDHNDKAVTSSTYLDLNKKSESNRKGIGKKTTTTGNIVNLKKGKNDSNNKRVTIKINAELKSAKTNNLQQLENRDDKSRINDAKANVKLTFTTEKPISKKSSNDNSKPANMFSAVSAKRATIPAVQRQTERRERKTSKGSGQILKAVTNSDTRENENSNEIIKNDINKEKLTARIPTVVAVTQNQIQKAKSKTKENAMDEQQPTMIVKTVGANANTRRPDQQRIETTKQKLETTTDSFSLTNKTLLAKKQMVYLKSDQKKGNGSLAGTRAIKKFTTTRPKEKHSELANKVTHNTLTSNGNIHLAISQPVQKHTEGSKRVKGKIITQNLTFTINSIDKNITTAPVENKVGKLKRAHEKKNESLIPMTNAVNIEYPKQKDFDRSKRLVSTSNEKATNTTDLPYKETNIKPPEQRSGKNSKSEKEDFNNVKGMKNNGKEKLGSKVITKMGNLKTIAEGRRENYKNMTLVTRETKASNLKKPKLLLLYTPMFGSIPWRSTPYDYKFTELDGTDCPVNNCKVTYDKKYLNQSDAVYFHGRDLPDAHSLRELRKTVNENQIWIWFMHESPLYTYYDPAIYDGIFNWSSTYNPKSEIFIPYFGMRKLKNNEERPAKDKNFASGKDKMVLFINSHCDELRMNFIRRLRKYIAVDVYGRCKNMMNPELEDCPRNSPRCLKLQSRYRFYLAIENAFCDEYVSEKYFKNGMMRNIVPLVMGGANYSDPRIALPNSYINIMKYSNLKQLADYLKYLANNQTAYNKYHQWSYDYKVELQHGMCKVCKALWEKGSDQRKVLKLSEFWSASKCVNKTAILNSYL